MDGPTGACAGWSAFCVHCSRGSSEWTLRSKALKRCVLGKLPLVCHFVHVRVTEIELDAEGWQVQGLAGLPGLCFGENIDAGPEATAEGLAVLLHSGSDG